MCDLVEVDPNLKSFSGAFLDGTNLYLVPQDYDVNGSFSVQHWW